VFDYIEQRARERYADYDLRWAFTSQFIINKLKKQGVVSQNVEQVVAALRQEGKTAVVFQSLHVVPGAEYEKLKDVDMGGLQVAFGDALMTTAEDIDAVVKALAQHIDPQQPTVVVAHGNDRNPQFNDQLLALARVIEKQYPHLVVASVEGLPGIEPLQKIKKLCETENAVRFVPLMIVAGDHIMNDVMGEDDDCWKQIVHARESECIQSLGWNDAILEIYFNHLDKAIRSL
jgi:sirohydrochlorin cobaltochelatase